MKNNYIKDIETMINYNISTLLRFEIIFKVLLSLILLPMIVYVFNMSMKITGYTYLTLENITSYLSNPLTILLLIVIVILLTMITLFDVSTIIIIFDLSHQKKKTTVKQVIRLSLKKCLKILRPNNIGVAFLLLFLIPFLNVGIGSNVVTSLKIPEFIMEYINSNTLLNIIMFIIYVILLSKLINNLFSIHYMVLESKNFKEAKKSSKNLINGNKLKDAYRILFIQLLTIVLFIISILLGVLGIYIFFKYFSKIKILESVFITIIGLFIALSLIIYAILANSISYSIISGLFYKHKIDKKENIEPLIIEEQKNKKSKMRYVYPIFILLSIIGGSIYTYQIISGKANLNIEHFKKTEITAHRGDSINHKENTIAAFKGAKDAGADWIELDVIQSKDNVLVISHDNNLYRLTGVNKNISDLKYEEINNIDQDITTLEEVILFAKRNSIRLNIELKITGKETNFEKSVIELINNYNFKDMCVISSGTYSVLENVKKIDKDIKTAYVMTIAIGNITDLEYADIYSIEATNVTYRVVNKVHNRGKEIYVWTVNKDENITKMIDMEVDNIITDNAYDAKKIVISSMNSNLIEEFIKIVRNL